ncbi:MAG TPA: hypothetical protein VLZ12_08010 [Verrucomicrobiae bacterium]|nr:hypothetical protein [Verrucomicrobiae bacterium]
MQALSKPPEAKSRHLAVTLNLLLPGAGLFYLGRRLIGSVLAIAFLGCFVAALTIFLRGYSEYLSVAVSVDLMQSQQLEHLADAFHVPWLVGLLAAGIVIHIASFVGLAFARRAR